MEHQKLHLFEKFQVQIAAAVLALGVYAGLWPLLAPADTEAPLIFLARGAWGGLLLMALVAWALAFLAGIATVHLRPAAGPLVAVLGVAGLSLHSPKINVHLWQYEPQWAAAYIPMIVELALLLVVLVGAVQMAGLGRRLIGGWRPVWQWKDPQYAEAGASDAATAAHPAAVKACRVLAALTTGAWLGPRPATQPPALPADLESPPLETLKRLGLACLTVLVLMEVVLFLLAQSADRGQVLFAVGAAGLLASMGATMAFPTRLYLPMVVVPPLVGIGHYIYAMVVARPTFTGWANLPLTARALPIDWLTLGAGGALAGYWIAARIREARFFEAQQQQRTAVAE